MHRTIMTMFLAVVLGTSAVGADRPSGPPGQGAAGARAEIQRFVKSYIDARNRADATAMMEMVGRTPGASAINEGTVLRGWEAIRDVADDMIAAEGSFKIVLGTLEVQPLGPSHALAVAPFVLTVEGDDGPIQIHGGLTLVLEKAGGRWKIIHEHQSAQPPEDEGDDDYEGDE
jgi:uncharacterized protein (TIGR02246 family)